MAKEYNYPTEDELRELVEKFITTNNLDAWWLNDDTGFVALGISHKVEDED
jgi:hypothetical protein